MTEKWGDHIQKGNSLYKSGKYLDALSHFQKALQELEKKPIDLDEDLFVSSRTFYCNAIAYEKLKEFKVALDFYRRFLHEINKSPIDPERDPLYEEVLDAMVLCHLQIEQSL